MDNPSDKILNLRKVHQDKSMEASRSYYEYLLEAEICFNKFVRPGLERLPQVDKIYFNSRHSVSYEQSPVIITVNVLNDDSDKGPEFDVMDRIIDWDIKYTDWAYKNVLGD